MGGGSLSIWGGAGWSHCLQMSPAPSAWPDPAPTWPVATQRPPANIHLFLQGTQTPQVTHAPRGQRKQGSRVPQAPWATPGGVERGTHCPHPELTARNPAGVPTGWQWPCRGGEHCGETAHRGPYPPHNWQPQRSVHPEEPPPWPRVRGSQDAPAACPASRVFINAGCLSGGPLSLISQSHEGA